MLTFSNAQLLVQIWIRTLPHKMMWIIRIPNPKTTLYPFNVCKTGLRLKSNTSTEWFNSLSDLLCCPLYSLCVLFLKLQPSAKKLWQSAYKWTVLRAASSRIPYFMRHATDMKSVSPLFFKIDSMPYTVLYSLITLYSVEHNAVRDKIKSFPEEQSYRRNSWRGWTSTRVLASSGQLLYT